MKKITLVIFVGFFLLSFFSCDKQDKSPESEFTFVDLPDHLKSYTKSATDFYIEIVEIKAITKEGKEVFGKMRFTIPKGDEETLIKFEMTKNIFNETELSKDFWVNQNENNLKSAMGIATCLKTCKTDFEKGDGRGWCKAGCWAELAAKVATAAAVIAIL